MGGWGVGGQRGAYHVPCEADSQEVEVVADAGDVVGRDVAGGHARPDVVVPRAPAINSVRIQFRCYHDLFRVTATVVLFWSVSCQENSSVSVPSFDKNEQICMQGSKTRRSARLICSRWGCVPGLRLAERAALDEGLNPLLVACPTKTQHENEPHYY